MRDFYIEKTRLKDTLALSKLECDCYGYGWHPYANWTWKTVANYGYAFTAKSRKGRKVIGGIAAIRAGRRLLYIDSLFVSAMWRRRGVGKLLLRKLIGATSRIFTGAEGHVDETNTPMIGLLEDLGFRMVGSRGNYYDEKPGRVYFLYRKNRGV